MNKKNLFCPSSYLWNPATSWGRSVICIRFATIEPIAPPRPVHNIIWVKTSVDGAIYPSVEAIPPLTPICKEFKWKMLIKMYYCYNNILKYWLFLDYFQNELFFVNSKRQLHQYNIKMIPMLQNYVFLVNHS